MNNRLNKWCFVPDCYNTAVNAPGKVFVTVPDDQTRKREWFKAVKRDLPISKSKFFCCEDHFNFEQDVENFMKYKLMGGHIRIKRNVVPHIFGCQRDGKGHKLDPETSAALELQRKRLVEEAIAESIAKSIAASQLCEVTTSTSSGKESAVHTEQTVLARGRSRGVQVKPYFRSKYIMCNIKPVMHEVAVSPLASMFSKNASTSPLKKRRCTRKIPFRHMSSSSESEGN